MRINTLVGSVLVTATAALGTSALAATPAIQAAVKLLADSSAIALIVPGTGTPDPTQSTNYMENAVNYYIAPNSAVEPCDATSCHANPVPYLAQFWPIPLAGWGGLDGAKWNDSVQSGVASLGIAYGAQLDPTQPGYDPSKPADPNHPVVIFGYSQGATVASAFKTNLAHLNNPDDPTLPDNVTFVLIGNPNRPNGGLFERLSLLGTVPILDATFGNPTPTDTADPGVTNTTDIAFQYDGVADFPKYPINVLADVNALAGFWYIHGTYLDPRTRPGDAGPTGELPYGYDAESLQDAMADPGNQQTHGDTVYVTIPATSLPIMAPFIDLGASTGTSALINPVVALLQPVTQTLIETGYDRTDYGNPSPFGIVPLVNPIKLIGDLIQDVPEGITAATTTINDPQHAIPALPPSWDTDPASTSSLLQTSLLKAQSPATTPQLPKLNLLRVDTPATATQKPKVVRSNTIHPVRDAVKSIRDSVRKALGRTDSKQNVTKSDVTKQDAAKQGAGKHTGPKHAKPRHKTAKKHAA